MHYLTTLLPVFLAATTVHATSCSTHTYTACADGITHWYDPDDGMICDPLDCGGGRAPPKTNVPCCPSYTGTLTCDNSPSYLPCFNKNVAASTAMGSMTQPTSAAAATTTGAAQSSAQPSSAAQGGSSGVASTMVSSGSAAPSMPTIAPVPSRNATVVSPSLGGSATSSSKPIATGNAASGLRYSPLVGVVGAVVLMV